MFKIIKMSENTKDYIQTFYQIFDDMQKGMENAEQNSSIAGNFINRIIPHMEAEIAMSENILKYTTNVEIEDMARSFISESKENIETLKSFKESCVQPSSERDLTIYENGYTNAYNKMIAAMSASQSGNNVDVDFLTQMIPHHQGGADMINNLLKFEVCEPLKMLAESMFTSNLRKTEQMKRLLRQLN